MNQTTVELIKLRFRPDFAYDVKLRNDVDPDFLHVFVG